MKTFARVCLIVVMIGSAVMGLRYALEESLLTIQAVNIVPDARSGEEILFKRIKFDLHKKVKSFKGQMIWEVSLDDVLKLVEEDTRVKSLSVHRRLPGRLVIAILPHKPAAVLMTKKHEIFPVARDGSLLPKVQSNEVPNVPVLRGREFFKDEKRRADVTAMLAELPTTGSFSAQNISEVTHTKRDGFVLTMNKDFALVKVGEEGYRQKSSRIEKVLKYLQSEQLQGRVIDARFRKKVVVKLRNEP